MTGEADDASDAEAIRDSGRIGAVRQLWFVNCACWLAARWTGFPAAPHAFEKLLGGGVVS
jgi:hypothetical protein